MHYRHKLVTTVSDGRSGILRALVIAFSLAALGFCGGAQKEARIQAAVSPAALHIHEVSINYRQLSSGIRSFPMSEVAGHRHTVVLNEDQAAMLSAGVPVVVESSEEQGHRHAVTLQIFAD